MITLSANTENSRAKTVTKHLTSLEVTKSISTFTRVPNMYVTPVAKDLLLRANLLPKTPSTQGYVCITVLKGNAAKVSLMQVSQKALKNSLQKMVEM